MFNYYYYYYFDQLWLQRVKLINAGTTYRPVGKYYSRFELFIPGMSY
jgi:hypothetical protein